MAAGSRYFVRVYAGDVRLLRELATYGLDLFQATAAEEPDGRCSIEGLVTMEDVGRLVDGGYEVLVQEEASRRARATSEITTFDEWRAGIEGS